MEKINIAEILKDCPKGMELNCVLFENVTFEGIKQDEYPIIVKIKEPPMTLSLTKTGGWNSYNSAKCVIYPKGKTTWEGFVPPYKFKDGDILFVKSTYDWLLIYKESGNDVDLYKYVSIPHNYPYYFITYDSNPICRKKEVSEIRLATEEEKAKLFQTIKDNGYKWNPETKTLEKLVEPKFKVGDKVKDKNNRVWFIVQVSEKHFDISSVPNAEGYFVPIEDQDEYELVPNKFDIINFEPFMKVLVRDNNEQFWTCDWFSFHDISQVYPFACVGHYVSQCIPYEENQHLLGTTNDCDEYYKTW